MCLACCRSLFLPILNDRRSSLPHHSLAHVNWLYVKEIAYGELSCQPSALGQSSTQLC